MMISLGGTQSMFRRSKASLHLMNSGVTRRSERTAVTAVIF